MDDVLTASTFVQVIDVLCDDRHVELVLQACHQFVSLVGNDTAQLLATFVIELLHEFGVTFVALNACHSLHGILLPKTTAVAEGADAAFCRHACTGEEY